MKIEFDTLDVPRTYMWPLAGMVDATASPDAMYSSMMLHCNSLGRDISDTLISRKLYKDATKFKIYLVDLPDSYETIPTYAYGCPAIYVEAALSFNSWIDEVGQTSYPA